MSEAAFTDSATVQSSPAATVSPTSGNSTNTMSPSRSWACSVIPTVTVPSPSLRIHSWVDAYFNSAGIWLILLSFVLKKLKFDQSLTVANKTWFGYFNGNHFFAHFYFSCVAYCCRYTSQCNTNA